MIALEINGRRYTKFNQFKLKLQYNSVASTFSFNFYDDFGEVSKLLVTPGRYVSAVVKYISENGTESTLITGVVLTHSKISSSKSQYIGIAGYSKTGVIEDCQIPVNLYPLQTIGQTFRQIATRLINPFGLSLIVNPAISNKVDKPIDETTANNTESIKSYLYELAYNRNLILSHTDKGELLITRADANSPVVAEFNRGLSAPVMSLEFDGQGMHSEITVLRQADDSGGNFGTSTVKNPFVGVYRPSVKIQTSGDDIDIRDAAARELGRELSNIRLTINANKWEANNKLIVPNTIISVVNPELGINSPTNFFIESVDYVGNELITEATLNCVIPEVYNWGTPKNFFE